MKSISPSGTVNTLNLCVRIRFYTFIFYVEFYLGNTNSFDDITKTEPTEGTFIEKIIEYFEERYQRKDSSRRAGMTIHHPRDHGKG